MSFSKEEREALLQLHGVGPTVLQRFEEIGINSLHVLRQYKAEDIADMVANMLNTTCWKNSPQAKNAINSAIDLANK
jgi:nucleotidyltransferase/DNA polymerase involved in DNA repair